MVKIFYTSPDSAIEVREGKEGADGIIKSIEELSSAAPLQTSLNKGKTAQYLPLSVTESFSSNRFIMFSPKENITATLTLVAAHPLVPIKLVPYQPAVKIILNKGDQMVVEPFVNNAELKEFSLLVGGKIEHIVLTFKNE
jgi:hypothetical protein